MPRTLHNAPAKEVLQRAQTEAQFQAWVVDIATTLKWTCHHPWTSMNSGAGWPDLVLIRGNRLIFAELKSEKGKTSIHQDWWLRALGVVAEANQTVEVFVWRPSDAEQIEEVLKRGA